MNVSYKNTAIISGRRTSKLFFSVLVGSMLALAACQKQAADRQNEATLTRANSRSEQFNPVPSYHLGSQTLGELQQARAATAKYQNINNAFNDGYEDIGLVMPNMGFHFMKKKLVDTVFDISHPELLVYNRRDDGSFELGAVEYAVPIDPRSPNTPPDGFTGLADEWDFNTNNTGLWTLHAWVWKFNPDGAFNMTNPLVIVR